MSKISILTYKKAKLIERMVDYYSTIGAKNPLLQAILIVEERIASRGRNGQDVESCHADPFNASNQAK